MENIMDMIRKSQITLTEKIIEIQFECLDTLEVLVENIDTPDVIDVSSVQTKLHELLESTSSTEQGVTAVPISVTTLKDVTSAKNVNTEVPEIQTTTVTPTISKTVMKQET